LYFGSPRNRSVEWEYSGWKSDLIAELVLGLVGDGSVEEKKTTATLWLAKLGQPSSPSSPDRY
jgi:hypothetical protein